MDWTLQIKHYNSNTIYIKTELTSKEIENKLRKKSVGCQTATATYSKLGIDNPLISNRQHEEHM